MNYVVQAGDTLSKIASRNGLTVREIVSANPQLTNPNVLSVGQRLVLPTAEGAGSSGGGGGGDGGTNAASDTRPTTTETSGANRSNTPLTSPNSDWILPGEGLALKLVPTDFANAARELGCETAAVRAVAEVESGGRSGFDAQKRPKILFEVHKFRKHTARRYDQSHPHLSAPYESPRRKESYRKDQWQVLREAFTLDPEAAVKSCSWGMFQVLGENHVMCGWRNVRTFVEDMFVSEAQHMRAFLGFCRDKRLTRHLLTKNWAAFALGYNGEDYASNQYDTKMAEAYRRYSRN
ncbi:LysM peptidoglycan-binding domain-containing protein [Polyangium sorediatum]|uniref:N-acetylmuramidase domain-containing protein n=1 Tax=Polyangium sorediatum TaxID=889274 RepID=A0ABT6NP33_9BACT|nr:N-acetylmuramidase domain-containing protein [Polyangium sorediatum]MDI1430048.1 N-acetylmuramidase domain-containing protein [Polyangium sorediatum]